MAGLLAWAADVVGGGGQGNEEEETAFSAVVFTPEQQKYARELEQRATSLRRSIQDLRLRIPPPDISQRLPHLHAHSLASNAALALQLNAHSATRQQAQLREVTLQEENAAYEKAISNCQKKIEEKLQETDLLSSKLEEMDLTEKSLRAELEKTEASLDASQSTAVGYDSKIATEALADREPPKHVILEELDSKKKELSAVEETVQNLELVWAQIQLKSAKQPSPAQREKILEKQLQSLIEQLESKQAYAVQRKNAGTSLESSNFVKKKAEVQAEHLVTEIHVKEKELEKLNGLWKRIENGNAEANAARNRFGRSSNSLVGSSSTDYIIDAHNRPLTGGRMESQQKLMLMRSAFVLYILALHVLVFIKISF